MANRTLNEIQALEQGPLGSPFITTAFLKEFVYLNEDGTQPSIAICNGYIELWEADREEPTDAEIQTFIDRLESEGYTTTKLMQNKRRKKYPEIGDQLDALFHAGVFPEDMAAQIQAVKDAHPKP